MGIREDGFLCCGVGYVWSEGCVPVLLARLRISLGLKPLEVEGNKAKKERKAGSDRQRAQEDAAASQALAERIAQYVLCCSLWIFLGSSPHLLFICCICASDVSPSLLRQPDQRIEDGSRPFWTLLKS